MQSALLAKQHLTAPKETLCAAPVCSCDCPLDILDEPASPPEPMPPMCAQQNGNGMHESPPACSPSATSRSECAWLALRPLAHMQSWPHSLLLGSSTAHDEALHEHGPAAACWVTDCCMRSWYVQAQRHTRCKRGGPAERRIMAWSLACRELEGPREPSEDALESVDAQPPPPPPLPPVVLAPIARTSSAASAEMRRTSSTTSADTRRHEDLRRAGQGGSGPQQPQWRGGQSGGRKQQGGGPAGNGRAPPSAPAARMQVRDFEHCSAWAHAGVSSSVSVTSTIKSIMMETPPEDFWELNLPMPVAAPGAGAGAAAVAAPASARAAACRGLPAHGGVRRRVRPDRRRGGARLAPWPALRRACAPSRL